MEACDGALAEPGSGAVGGVGIVVEAVIGELLRNSLGSGDGRGRSSGDEPGTWAMSGTVRAAMKMKRGMLTVRSGDESSIVQRLEQRKLIANVEIELGRLDEDEILRRHLWKQEVWSRQLQACAGQLCVIAYDSAVHS